MSPRTISVAGAFISVVLFMVATVLLWFISRTVLNRLAHYVTGNPSKVSAELESFNNGEAVYKVQGKNLVSIRFLFKEGQVHVVARYSSTTEPAGMLMPHS